MSRQRDEVVPGGRSEGETARRRLLAGLPVEERRLVVAGVPTAVLEGGDGPPIVFLQAEFALVWLRVTPGLVRTHHVVVPDLPGLGASELPDGRYDVATAVRWLGALIDRTCEVPPVLVGKGPAGALAARYAVDHGDRLAGLVLVDAHGLARFRPRPGMALSYMGVLMRPTVERVEQSFGTYCFTDLDRVRSDMGERWDRLSAYVVHCFRNPKVRKTMRTLLPRLGKAIPHEDLLRIGVATTLIWGQGDLGMRVEVAEAASARYGWPLHVIEGARDDPALEQPELFLTALLAALERSSPSPS